MKSTTIGDAPLGVMDNSISLSLFIDSKQCLDISLCLKEINTEKLKLIKKLKIKLIFAKKSDLLNISKPFLPHHRNLS